MAGDQRKDDDSLQDLKDKLQFQLEQSGMTDFIKKLVEDECASKEDVSLINPDEVLEAIYKRGLMKNIMDKFDTLNTNNTEPIDKNILLCTPRSTIETKSIQKSNNNMNVIADDGIGEEPLLELDSDITFSEEFGNQMVEFENIEQALEKGDKRYYLKVEILGGKAFLDHLSHENNVKSPTTTPTERCSYKLVLHVFYKSQRFTTKPVDCRCDPHFKDVLMIDIGYFQSGSVAGLLGMNEPLRIVITREDVNPHSAGGTAVVISYTLHDWRSVLLTDNGLESFTLELMGTGPEHSVPVGLLNVKTTLLPSPDEQVTESTFLKQIQKEQVNQEDRNRSLIAYTKKWWKDFIDIRPGHVLRAVKIFAYDERMRSNAVVSFVQPMISDSVFLTPFHAAWFTSLLPLKQNDPVSQQSCDAPLLDERTMNDKPWQSLESTITSKHGGVEDHAVLLCSLLLGFGLNAFVALGSKKGRSTWAWTVTFDNSFQPTFWESTTGKHFKLLTQPLTAELPDELVTRMKKNEFHGFQSIGTLFNNDMFLVNIQITDSVNCIDWNILDLSKWKCIPSKVLNSIPRSLFAPTLRNPTIDSELLRKEIEMEVKELIIEARMRQNLTTRWDENMSKLMGQQLATYELEASTGGSNFENFFEVVVIKYIPAGYDFKGFPFHTRSSNPRFIFYSCVRDPKCQEVVYCRGDDIQHSVRAMIFSYPENVLSVRIMISCRYISTD